MAKARDPNAMKEAHIHRLDENWHLVEEFLDIDDIKNILKDKGVLDTKDVELIETYSSKKGFKYLFVALTEYGGAKGLHVFVDALKLKDNKYATIISELSEELEEPNDELDDKNTKIFKLERQLEGERNKRIELEKKLEKMKTESASKDKEIHRLKTELNDVTKTYQEFEETHQTYTPRVQHSGMRKHQKERKHLNLIDTDRQTSMFPRILSTHHSEGE